MNDQTNIGIYEKYELTEKNYKIIRDVMSSVLGKLKRLYNLPPLDDEDYFSEAWVKILEYELENNGHFIPGSEEYEDKDRTHKNADGTERKFSVFLLREMLENFFLDKIRKSIRRKHDSLDKYTDDGEQSERDNASQIAVKTYDENDIINKIVIHDLLNKFPEGSKEKEFIKWRLQAAHLGNFGIDVEGRKDEGYTDENLAKYLGYKSSTYGGFRGFKDKMDAFMQKYFRDNLIDKEESYAESN